MVKRIKELTDEQRSKMPEWRDRWIKIGLRTGEADWHTFEEAVDRCYRAAGLLSPKRLVRIQSPIVGALAAPIASFILKQHGGAIGDAVDSAVRAAIDGAVDAAVGAIGGAVRDAVDDAVGGVVCGAVDDAVDAAVGAVGGAIDDAVGGAVRDAVDAAVDDAVGAIGGAVRDAVGDAVGAIGGVVRDAVDAAVDAAVDGAVDDAVDDAVGAVRAAVGGVVCGAVDDAVGAVRAAIGGAVRDAIGDAVDAAVDGAVDGAVDDAVRGAVRDAIGGAVAGAVDAAVDDAIGGAIGDELKQHIRNKWCDYLGGQFWVGGWWWGSPSYASFFTDVCGLDLGQELNERALAYRRVCESVCWWWPHKGFVMVCNRPREILRDGQGRIHSTARQAISWPDGWGFYSIHGVRFDEELFKKVTSGQMTFKEIIALENIEQRMIALKIMSPEKLLQDSGAKLLNKTSANELYLIQNIFDSPAYFLKYSCPSTGRVYVSGVPPEIGVEANADKAMAWKFGLETSDYLGITAQA